MKYKFKNYVTLFMTLLLVFSGSLPITITVVKGQDTTETDIVTPIPISQTPHESDYESYPYLLDNGVKNAVEDGNFQ